MPKQPFHSLLKYIQSLVGKPPTEETDRDLLERFTARQDQNAFQMLVCRHGPMVLDVCRKMLSNVEDAEDAFQATFLVLVRRAGAIPWRDSVGGWLHRVAYRVAEKSRGRLSRRQTVSLSDVTQKEDPMADRSQAELHQVLHEELQKMPAKHQTPLVLCYLEGRTHDEAAQEMDVPRGSIVKRLDRAQEHLRRRLVSRGVSLPAVTFTAVLAGNTARAVVSAKLVDATVKAANLFAAGKVVSAGVVSSSAVILAEGVTEAMLYKAILHGAVKTAAALVLLLGMAGTGTWAYRIWAMSDRDKGNIPQLTVADNQAFVTPKVDKPRTDLHGDRLPPGAISRFGTTRLRPGKLISTWTFSPDGNHLVSAGDGKICLFDSLTGKEWFQLPVAQFPQIQSLALSHSNRFLSYGTNRGGKICIWDLIEKKELGYLTPSGELDGVGSLVFSPDEKTLVSLQVGFHFDPSLIVWDLSSRRELRIAKGPVWLPTFSPDGKTLAVTDASGRIRLYEMATGKERARFFTPGVQTLAFSLAGLLASGHTDGSVWLWDCNTGKPSRKLRESEKPVISLAFTCDSKSLVCSYEGGRMLVWDHQREVKEKIAYPCDFYSNIYPCSISPNGKLFGRTTQHRLIVGEVSTGKERPVYDGHSAPIGRIFFSSDGQTLISSSDDGVRSWCMKNGKQVRFLPNPGPEGFSFVVVSPDGKRMAAGGWDYPVRIVEFSAQGKGKEDEPVTLPKNGDETKSFMPLTWSADGNTLWLRERKTQRLWFWDVSSGKLQDQKHSVPRFVVIDRPNRLLAAGSGRGVCLSEIATGKRLWLLDKDNETLTAAFSDDGKVLATAKWRPTSGICLWDTATGQERLQLLDHDDTVCSLAFSPNGNMLASGSLDQTVRLWDVKTGKVLHRFKGHQSGISAVAFSPDGKLLASGSHDTSILVWDLKELGK